MRAAWRVEVSGRLGASRLVFVDEMGSNTSLSPLYGWAKVGERLRAAAPKNWGKNPTLISSMTLSGMGPSVAVEGATTRAVFEAYVEQALVPNLSPGQVVIMDNLLRPTREEGYGSSSRGRDASCSTCRLTPRT